MKRALSLVLVACGAFFPGQILRGPIPLAGAAGGGAGTLSGNGDVNGDGALNLTDVIYCLQHLFQGGPVPVPITSKRAGLPATGQTKCYDAQWPANETDCAKCLHFGLTATVP